MTHIHIGKTTGQSILLVLLLGLAPLAGGELPARQLVIEDFETPVHGHTFRHYPGGLCEATLQRSKDAARTGEYGARLDFAHPLPRPELFVGWEYMFDPLIVKGAKTLSLWYRTDVEGSEAHWQVLDANGQFFVARKPLAATGEFEKVTFDLSDPKAWQTKSKEPMAYPLLMALIGISAPEKQGRLDLDSLTLTTTADEQAQPSVHAELGMEPFGNLFKPGHTPKVDLYVIQQQITGGRESFKGTWRVRDWQGREVLSGQIDAFPVSPGRPTQGQILLEGLVDKGAFNIEVTLENTTNAQDRIRADAWFGVLPSESVTPSPWVGTCLHWDHGWGNGEMRILDIMKAVGIGVFRQDISWPSWERKPGEYQSLAIYDKLAQEANKRGIEWDLKLYRNHPGYENQLDPDAHARFAAWLAEHYKDQVTYFEIWNEPANCFFRPIYGGDKTGRGIWVTKFVEFTNKTAKAIKDVRPDAKVLVASEDVFFRLQEMLEKGIGKYADIIAIHAYSKRAIRPETSEFLGDGFAALRAWCRHYDAPQRIAVTESGWTTSAGDDIKHLDWAGSFTSMSYKEQAAYLIRMYLLAHAAGVEFVTNYDFKNDGPRRDYTENNFGIVHEDFSPKPALLAIANLTRLLGDSIFVAELAPCPGQSRQMVFRTKGSQRILAAWAVQGTVETTVAVKQPTVELVDLMGNRRTLAVNEGKVTLSLGEVPVYLITAGPIKASK